MSGRIRTAVALMVATAALVGACALPAAARAVTPGQTLEQAISDKAQGTTIAFDGLAFITGNLDSQSFFPPGKVADYWGFQYLRDNDPDDMGHNTELPDPLANNVHLHPDDAQFAQLKTLAAQPGRARSTTTATSAFRSCRRSGA